MTGAPTAHTIGYVPFCYPAGCLRRRLPPRLVPRRLGLTRRRAVDFCRVATALCPVGRA